MSDKLPLFKLFLELREPLGLRPDHYELLLEALEKGFGYQGIEDLRSICQILWLKSRGTNEEKIFNRIFDDYATQCQTLPKIEIIEIEEISLIKSATAFSSVDDYPPLQTQPKTTQTRHSDDEVSPETLPIQKSHSDDDRVSPKTPTEKSHSDHKVFPKTTPAKTPPPLDTRVPTAYQTTPPINITHSEKGYTLTISDFPFLERTTRQNWRRLRQQIQEGFTEQVDIRATLQIIARDGICLTPPQKPQWVNQIELLFLEDIDGSMVPFRPIIQELFNTVEPRKFKRVSRYYFRNCPGEFVYKKPKGAEIIRLEDLYLKSNATIVIIISDAGAARRGYNPHRAEMTKNFVEYLQPRVKALIWLNPIPYQRWEGTTAEKINALIDGKMFELPQGDLNLAISCAKRGSGG